MNKDQQYWKEYNSKRREYNRIKQQEYRARLKVADTIPVADSQLKDKVADIALVADKQGQAADRIKEQAMVADKVADQKLWSDYYFANKPFCLGCRQKNIPSTAYAFCSQAKDTTDPDFPNLYFCQVYHWTVYQGRKNC